MFDRLGRDVRYAGRQLLLRSPVSTTVAVVSLAVGITVAVTAFSLVNSILFRPLPVTEPERVVHVFASSPQPYFADENLFGRSALDDLEHYAGSGVFSGVVAWQSWRATVTAGDVAPARHELTFVSPGFFDVLGIEMAAGRRPTGEDAFEIVISEQYRRRTFADGQPVVGTVVDVNGIEFTVAGVATRAFHGLDPVSAAIGWIPAATMQHVLPADYAELGYRTSRRWYVAARLMPGVTQDVASARLTGTASALADAYPGAWRSEDGRGRKISLLTPQERVLAGNDDLPEILAVLAVTVGIVLLLACTNVAGLLLAQSVSRRHEIAVRLALGASRRQLSAQLLTESLLLAVIGVAAGLLGSRAAVGWMGRRPTFDAFDLTLDWRVLAATTALCFVCALLFGVTPMGQTLRVDVKSGLTGQGVISERGGVRGRLIALQVALSCMLLVLGVHASRGLLSFAHTPPGFEMDGLLVAQLDMDPQAMDSVARRHYLEHAVATMRSLPGVVQTGLSMKLPTLERVVSAGAVVTTPSRPITVGLQTIDTDYFETLGQPLLIGSMPDDVPQSAGGPHFAVINGAFAAKMGGRPIGTTVRRLQREYTIVAVVDDGGGREDRQSNAPVFYALQSGLSRYGGTLYLIARFENGSGPAAMAQFATEIRNRYPTIIPPHVGTLRAQLEEHYTPQRYIANTALGIAGMQLLLAALGLYSLLLYATLARTREIGLRMALGARPRRASLTVMREGLLYVLAGVALGVALGVPGAIFASNNFIGGDAADPVPFAAALLAIALSTAAAAYIPARRAARVQPMAALRTE